jgi:VIT1/CCC1 family predicted Fe2+/Mn2+ transporter
MGLGNFLSVRSEQHQYEEARKGEQVLILNSPETEYQETIAIMVAKGFTADQAKILADIYRTNEDYWIDFMMNHELELPDPRGENPAATGFATFISFMIFGAIPLLPFMFEVGGSAREVFTYSVVGTFVALVSLGLLKWRVIGAHLGKSLTEVVLVGGVAAVIAYYVGTFFAA